MDDTGLVPVGVVATRPLVAEMLPDAAFPPADLPQPEATSANAATTAAAVHMPRLRAISPPAYALRPATAGWSLLVSELAPYPGRGYRCAADLVVTDVAQVGVDDGEVCFHALANRAGGRV